MVSRSKIDLTFIQKNDTCVLASYGIAAKYFTGICVDDFFKGYCDHFGLSVNNSDYQFAYNEHFHKNITNYQSGYHCIQQLHQNSSQDCFQKSKAAFNFKYFDNTMQALFQNQITPSLLNSDALLLLSLIIDNTNYHSVIIGQDSCGIFLRNPKIPFTIKYFSCLQQINQGLFKDSLLLLRK